MTAILVLIITVPLILLTMRLVKEAEASKFIHDTVAAEIASLPDAELLELQMVESEALLQLDITILTTQPPDYKQVVALQEELALRLDRTVALELIVVPGRRLDPLVPPTRTPTLTPSPTMTVQPTATRTLTASPSATATLTYTPTPVPAVITNTGGHGAFLYERPAENIIGVLPEGTRIQILHTREFVNDVEWLEILSPAGIKGWVPIQYVMILP